MINITSEGNLFTSFCTSVAGTASFQHLTVTALNQFQFFIQSFIFVRLVLIFVRLVLIFLLAIFVGSICCLYNCVTTVYATVG